ncbi:hypothetical protein COU56_01760 [Candidatus Pacearchaeota archaeon CG10_big_fil_rev_8_21_14_0_10_31_9]|nr:MAG: hypothetical protein AUJ62_02420 [Candidatus Pacearchaeota archaeon CG1_02_32_21]PIN95384.1 MAG: hypothetical protein COU56_01760 [Candidatus Pacearchaeota archaeon CG10_big_fil_rev_8_21_14_0_10_31_9]
MKKILSFVGGIVILLISGYIFGIITENNFLIGIVLFIAGSFYLIWSFSKNIGWFKEHKSFIKLILLFFSKFTGFILGFFDVINVYGIKDHYKFTIILFILFLYALIIGLKEVYNLIKHKN